jgi:hypothetical protein
MSPNEAQLRAALHEGEGDTLDPGVLIAHATWVRRERRRRVFLAAGAAAAVAVVGVGIAAWVNTGGGGRGAEAGGAAAQAQSAGSVPSPAHRHRSPLGGPVAHDAVPRLAPGMCPTRAPRYLLPGGGGSGQFGASEPLFTHDVAKIVVCGYPAAATTQSARRLVLKAGQATEVASALESAPSSAVVPGRKCANVDTLGGTIDLLATDANGAASKPVVITLGCPRSMATNGTAVRYVTDLPGRLIALLGTAMRVPPDR